MEATQTNIDWFNNRFISKDGQRLFCQTRICAEFLGALYEQDKQGIEDLKIYFNPGFSPASQATIYRPLEQGVSIISFDLNCLKNLSHKEIIAILLHELGHIFHPATDMTQREYNADDFARARGYCASIVSSLKALSTTYPDQFPADLTEKRINRLENDQ
jgi:hypothetical protein